MRYANVNRAPWLSQKKHFQRHVREIAMATAPLLLLSALAGATAFGYLPADEFPTDAPYTFMSKTELKIATPAWMSDTSAAEATYGHIRSWDTSQITDMTHLFCGCPSGGCDSYWSEFCDSAYDTFNEDIGAWDVRSVTNMGSMLMEE